MPSETTQYIDMLFTQFKTLWGLIVGSWILSFGLLVAILAIIVDIYNARRS